MVTKYMETDDIVNAVARYIAYEYETDTLFEELLGYFSVNITEYKFLDGYFDILMDKLEMNDLKHDFKNYSEYDNYVANLEDEDEMMEYFEIGSEVDSDTVIDIIDGDYTQSGRYIYPYEVPDMYTGNSKWEYDLEGAIPENASDYDVFKTFLKLGRGEDAFEDKLYEYFVKKYFK